MCFKRLFKRKTDNTKFTGMWSDIKTQEQFNELLLNLYKQECALEDEQSYFELQDTLFGEMFDNAIRIKFLIKEHPDFYANIDDDEFHKRAKELYLKDKEKIEDEENKTI